jgi:hypothetical protein
MHDFTDREIDAECKKFRSSRKATLPKTSIANLQK